MFSRQFGFGSSVFFVRTIGRRKLIMPTYQALVATESGLAFARQQIAKYPAGRQASAVIAILWRAQEQSEGWVSEAAIRVIADMLDMPYIRVLEVATFYTMFQLAPVGKKAHVQVCGTTPCRLRGAEDLIHVCEHRIHHEPFHLSKDGNFSWEEVECLGSCGTAPAMQVGDRYFENLTPERMREIVEQLRQEAVEGRS